MSKLKALVFFLVIALCGCGGGGGDGSGGSVPGSGSLSYTGLTTQAAVTVDNAGEISSSALSMGTTGNSVTGIARAAKIDSEYTSFAPRSVLAIDKIVKTIEYLDVTAYPRTSVSKATVSESDTLYGECGGQVAANVQYDDVTGAFSGSLAFGNYCEMSETVNGSATFSGVINLNTSEFESMVMNLNDVTVSSSEDSFSIDGSISVAISQTSVEMTMNTLVMNNSTNLVYRMSDFTANLSESGSGFSILMSGRFYSPSYGYVVLSTPNPLMIGVYDSYPYSGQLLLTGESFTAARLTALNSTSCELEVDADGDGSYEYDSGTVMWESLPTLSGNGSGGGAI